MKYLNSQRGVVLIQVLIMSLILGLVAVVLMRISFGGRVTITQQRLSISAKQVTEAAYVNLMTCLQNNAVPYPAAGGCGVVPAPCNALLGTYNMPGFPAPYNNVTVSLNPPHPAGGCRFDIVCNDCLGTAAVW